MRESGAHPTSLPFRKESADNRSGKTEESEPKIHSLGSDKELDDDSLTGSLEVNNVRQTIDDVIWVEPKVNGQNLQMELDTGSVMSTLPFQKYKELFPKTPLVKTEAILKTYSGERLTPEGKLYVRMEHNNHVKDLTLYVVDTHGPALFGRDWLHQIQLDWKLICSIAHMQPTQGTQKRLERLLEDYSEVFQDGVGTLKSTKANLTLKEGSQPKFCKARPVPYAIKPKVEEVELKHLEREGIIHKVKFSDWATPVVTVVKPNGTVRICGDYRNTINPQLEEYPLPRIDDIFAKLAGGQSFTKIDLKQAYHQMELDENSQEYLMINTHQDGGAVASWLVRLTPDRVVRVRGLAGDIVLCSWAKHFTLTVPLSTQVYKWVPANSMLGVTLRWTSIPSRGK